MAVAAEFLLAWRFHHGGFLQLRDALVAGLRGTRRRVKLGVAEVGRSEDRGLLEAVREEGAWDRVTGKRASFHHHVVHIISNAEL